MNNIPQTLILYSTVDGQTKKICDYIAKTLNHQVTDTDEHQNIDCLFLEEFLTSAVLTNTDAHALTVNDITEHHITQKLAEYDRIIIGASIRYGKHRSNLMDFIKTYRHLLEQKSTVFFSVNLVARKALKNTAETNPYLTKFLAETEWQPTVVDVFAGKLDYSMYGLFDKLMIKFIMWMTKGPTHSDVPIEFTDWSRVDELATKIDRF